MEQTRNRPRFKRQFIFGISNQEEKGRLFNKYYNDDWPHRKRKS